MTELIKIKGLKGKQNKKKWNKNIDVSALLEHVEQQHTQKVRDQFPSTLVVEDENDQLRKPLNPDRFKHRPQPLPKTKYDNRIKKQSILDDPVSDAWGQQTQILCKYKAPQIPAIIKPSTGHSYNPTQQSIKQVVEQIIDYEQQRVKKTKQIKKPAFKEQQVRHRNKNVRAQQLATRQRKLTRQRLHEAHSYKKIARELEDKEKMIQEHIREKQEKQKKWLAEAKMGKVRYGKKVGKIQYKFREELPNLEDTGKKLSHVGGNSALIKDRFDSVYRRGIFEPRVIKVHANKTKRVKSSLRYREDKEEEKKDKMAIIQ